MATLRNQLRKALLYSYGVEPVDRLLDELMVMIRKHSADTAEACFSKTVKRLSAMRERVEESLEHME